MSQANTENRYAKLPRERMVRQCHGQWAIILVNRNVGPR